MKNKMKKETLKNIKEELKDDLDYFKDIILKRKLSYQQICFKFLQYMEVKKLDKAFEKYEEKGK